MVAPIHVKVFLEVVGASEGSDIYAVKERLEQKVLDETSEIVLDKFGPGLEAVHILCVALQRFYKEALTENLDPLAKSLNTTLNLFAYKNWEARQKFGIKGDAVKDRLHSLDRFAEASFNLYCSTSTYQKAAQS